MQQQIHYISALRILATFLVILIHASTGYLNVFHAHSFDWNYANLLNSFSRFCVPLFVLISGALLLQKREEPLLFYKKRMSRILWPFLFWLLVYLVYYFYRYTQLDVLPLSRIIEISIDKLLHGPSAHLWFLYMIVGLYLAVPFLQILVHEVSDKTLLLFIALWFASLFMLEKSLYAYVPKIDLTFFSGYVGYMLLGYFLATRSVQIPNVVLLIIMVAIGLGNSCGTWFLSQAADRYTPTLYNYLGPTNAVLASAVFLVFKNSVQQPLPRPLQWIDQHSFGIYLVHILVLNYIHPLISWPTAWKIPVVSIITLGISLVLTFGLRKLPLGKTISG